MAREVTYQLVQVRFGDSLKRYTYLAPSDWDIRIGDEVGHRNMSPFSPAIVCEFKRSHVDFSLDFVVLQEHMPKPRSQAVTVEVPPGYVVKVVPE